MVVDTLFYRLTSVVPKGLVGLEGFLAGSKKNSKAIALHFPIQVVQKEFLYENWITNFM
jgi:hypothetical protein